MNRRTGALLLALEVVVCGCVAVAMPAAVAGSAGTPPTVRVTGGLNDSRDPTIVVNEYLPAEVTVPTGTTVTWTMAGPEPHSVTFPVAGASARPTLDDDMSLLVPTRPATAGYDGSAFVNSGVVPLGKDAVDFSLKFTTPGRYSYYCVVHPGMEGTVTVSSRPQPRSAATAARDGRVQREKYLAEGRAAKARLLASRPSATRNADGSTTYRIAAGASTPHTEILAFAPSPQRVEPGDHVTFVNESGAPHTASFGGASVPLNPQGDDVRRPVPGPSPQPLVPETYVNSGWLPPASDALPTSARSFTFDVPDPGRFTYVCVLHLGSGMAGAIDVGP